MIIDVSYEADVSLDAVDLASGPFYNQSIVDDTAGCYTTQWVCLMLCRCCAHPLVAATAKGKLRRLVLRQGYYILRRLPQVH